MPRRCLLDLPLMSPAGSVPSLLPAYPAFSLYFCPLSPRPPSPAGKGENFSFLMQGASPLASPGLNPGGTGAGGVSRAGGSLPSLPPAYPAFSCPLSPQPPSPAGKGETQSLFRRGSAPGTPGVEPAVRRKTDRTAFLLAVPAAKERGDRGRGTSAFEMVLSPGADRASAARGGREVRQRRGWQAAKRENSPP